MRISDEDVETERRVIEEEWRGKNGVSQRILHKYWEAVFGNGGADLIANRFPIGLPEVRARTLIFARSNVSNAENDFVL